MPRKKITIAEAFKTLEEAGIQVSIKNTVEQPQVKHVSSEANESQPPKPEKAKKGFVKLALFAKHSVGCGGFMHHNNVENAGVEIYGPGVVLVPKELVEYLVYQDNLARQADERLLEKEQRSYLVVQRQAPNGQRVNVPVRVPNSVFDYGFDLAGVGTGNMINIS